MILLIAALIGAPLKGSALFDVCVADHSKLKAYSVHIDDLRTVPGKREMFQYDLAIKGTDGLLRVREPATGLLDRSDRSFIVRVNKLVGYDAVAGERLQRSLKGHDSVEGRLATQLGALGDSLSIAIDPRAMRKFFDGFRTFRDWNQTQSGNVITLRRSAKGAATVFKFAGSPPLLREVSIKLKDSVLDWTYSFRKGANIALSIPSDARLVSSFVAREAPPKYDSPKAKEVVEKMIKAYGALQFGTIRVKSDEGDTTLFLAGRRLREDGATFSWAYDGSILTIRNKKTRKFYRGKAIRVILAEYITKVGGEVDPIIRRIVAHRVPYLDLFPTQATVKHPGTRGDTADILDVTSPSLKVSLFVRKDNHLMDSMESETIDTPGKVQTQTQRHFSYSHLGTPAGAGQFRLQPDSARVLPLPKLEQAGAK